MKLQFPERTFTVLALIALLALGSVFLHKTRGYLGTVPMATDDDTIPNVSINLWKNHKYGFPASPSLIHYGLNSEPILKEKHFDGTHDYYNYGWFYFVTTGFLNWAAGDDSLLFFRMMNPLGLLFIALLGVWLFSSISLLPGALLTVGLVSRFLLSVSPVMARPDIAVSVTASLFFVSAFFAFEKATLLWWFLTGFWAATAATSHLVAWSLVLAAAFTWGLFYLARAKSEGADSKIIRQSFLGILSGGLSGIFIYLVMMGFRVSDLWSFVSFLNQHVKRTPYFANMFSHFRMAWTSSGFTFFLGFGGFLLGLALICFSYRMPKEKKLKILALLCAPILSVIFYVLSLGAYRGMANPSYGILTYVSTMWAMAAAIAAGIWLVLQQADAEVRPFYFKVSKVLALLLLVFSLPAIARLTPNLEKLKYGWVKYEDYEHQVLDALPKNAYAWGTLNFGFTSGVRTELIDSNSALALAFHYSEEGWKKIAPDYLALTSYYTLESYLRAGPLSGKDSPIAVLRRKLPSFRYDLTRIVYAPPYGNTFLYRKVPARERHDDSNPLTLAVNDGTHPEWFTTLTPIGPYELETLIERKISPVTVDAKIWGIPKAQAHTSVRLELERGFYLITARVAATDPEQTGAVIATPGKYFYAQEDVRLQHAPLLRGQTEGSFIVDHLGGPLYLSYFPGRLGHKIKSHKPFEVIRVARVLDATNTKTSNLPHFSKWILNPKVVAQVSPGGEIEVSKKGVSALEPMLTSPAISVKTNHAYTLVLPSDANTGALQVAVLGKNEKTLLFGETRPLPNRVGLYTGSNDAITIKLYSLDPHGVGESSFVLRSGELIDHEPESGKIAALLSCPTTGKWVDGSTKPCSPVDEKELRMLDDDLKNIYVH